MTEDEWETRAAYRLAADVVRAKNLHREPIEAWLTILYNRLETRIRMSRARQETARGSAESDVQDGWIGSPQAAAILGWSKRQVQRLASDLDGRIASGRWIFRESVVREYKERMNDGSSSSGS